MKYINYEDPKAYTPENAKIVKNDLGVAREELKRLHDHVDIMEQFINDCKAIQEATNE